MTEYGKPAERPDRNFFGFDHVTLYVSNALQAADFYTSKFGFDYHAYQGLETGSRDFVTHVIKKGEVLFAFRSPLNPGNTEFASFLSVHGDAVKDVAFTVEDCAKMFEVSVARGAVPVTEPHEEKDEHGSVVLATVKTYGDVVHTFVERKNYTGLFLPGFKPHTKVQPVNPLFDDTKLGFIDHIVGNQPDAEMTQVADWYEKILDFHRFWSVDDKQIHTEYSALRSIVMTDFDRRIKMPINEPALGKKKSQIQEYVDYNGGAGVQHIAINVRDIITAVTSMKKRGLQFLTIPKSYYKNLRERLAQSPTKVKESLDVIEDLNILVDFDDNGYLLQIFTKPLQDRPTLFIEIIQRENHEGFGAGNFKSLFESIELEQERRGNLV